MNWSSIATTKSLPIFIFVRNEEKGEVFTRNLVGETPPSPSVTVAAAAACAVRHRRESSHREMSRRETTADAVRRKTTVPSSFSFSML
ncbi:hypothetical protein HanXRQr2_Chr04g0180001 [Helianthus annuus]|uniref:Uncharacterized protein n=1 Tax=Helianthus annuus TaxID=4232 RepID=A0A9K3NTZ1_HELAN|nr:hypothetical protein HanXRQr2_Chr04g0180001 [Helianthus annuus]KAJ0932422.1 hypothetical protein HanPSC8_Chr04g0173461 [Helianthus annuus]